MLGLVSEALSKRVVGSTKSNDMSSRSHALFQLQIFSQDDHGEEEKSLFLGAFFYFGKRLSVDEETFSA